MTNIIEAYGPDGRIVRFENRAGVYPTNHYQSLVLATSASFETLACSVNRQTPLRNMRALELCCGGGSASIYLKMTGLGHVVATDVQEAALDSCRHNASLNGVTLDAVDVLDVLRPPTQLSQEYDIVACNPPCGRPERVLLTSYESMRIAIDGGTGGIRFISPMLQFARESLRIGGRLVFIITSTMDFRAVWAELDHFFPGNWRLDNTTPLAQPYVRASSNVGQEFLKLGLDREVFVWRGEDDWVWRITWVIVAEKQMSPHRWFDSRLWFQARSYENMAPDYLRALARFTTT